MKNNYPYLRDPRAILEIRKHQWIESEKAGREIGFGTAAIDWVTRYGQAWSKIHAKAIENRSIFFEKRRYRRFILESAVTLLSQGEAFLVRTVDASYRGTQCCLSVGNRVVIQWSFESDGKSGLAFEARVERISAHKDTTGQYTILLKFNKHARKKIENLSFLKAL